MRVRCSSSRQAGQCKSYQTARRAKTRQIHLKVLLKYLRNALSHLGVGDGVTIGISNILGFGE